MLPKQKHGPASASSGAASAARRKAQVRPDGWNTPRSRRSDQHARERASYANAGCQGIKKNKHKNRTTKRSSYESHQKRKLKREDARLEAEAPAGSSASAWPYKSFAEGQQQPGQSEGCRPGRPPWRSWKGKTSISSASSGAKRTPPGHWLQIFCVLFFKVTRMFPPCMLRVQLTGCCIIFWG